MQLKDTALLVGEAYAGGEWLKAAGGAEFAVTNPATGEVVAEVADCGSAETRRAIDAADAAQRGFARLSAADRASMLMSLHSEIVQNIDDLATIVTLESGKPWGDARGEIMYGASFLKWYAEEAPRIFGEVIPAPSPSKRVFALKQAVGVAAAITPWNFPHAMVARKIAPAFAVGCATVVKPSRRTPLSALALAVLAERAGFPEGVFNVIPGADPESIGAALCGDPRVRKLSFTGAAETGRKLMQACAQDFKKLTLELSGNSPFIVFEDADLRAAAAGAAACKFRNAGQTRICANRIYVHDSVYDEFVDHFAANVGSILVGDPFGPATAVGPLIDTAAAARAQAQVDDALSKGAKIEFGGFKHALGGSFFTPTVLIDCTEDMLIAQQETFGPVAPLFRFSSEDEVIERANAVETGLAAYFYTRDLARCWRVSEALDYGIVGVNDALPSNPAAPFGGMKASGLGREGARYGAEEFLEVKYLSMGGL